MFSMAGAVRRGIGVSKYVAPGESEHHNVPHGAALTPRAPAFFLLEKATIRLHIAAMSMDAVFRALADPVRRQLLDRLHARNGQTLGELCQGHDMTRQAVTKHLSVLEAANLVATLKQGREKLHYLNPVPIHDIAERWIGKYERPRLKALADLKKTLEGKSDD